MGLLSFSQLKNPLSGTRKGVIILLKLPRVWQRTTEKLSFFNNRNCLWIVKYALQNLWVIDNNPFNLLNSYFRITPIVTGNHIVLRRVITLPWQGIHEIPLF
ncbi:Uncharacterised protein [Mycobacterium tuberculosis]|nr:Uncharacterised protein [Mycobacterium tuberculosis]